jgi:zinc and cadmium transporter
MNELIWIFLATLAVSAMSFVGALTLVLSGKLLKKLLLVLIGFSAGAMIGGAFIHLLPEALAGQTELTPVFMTVIIGFSLFFILEKLLWRHCHEKNCPIHVFAYLNLVGDGIHNFIDGLVMATSFIAGIPLGIATSIAIAAHEIPQELGDFGVLIYGGIKPRRALLLNFATAITAIAGGLIGYFLLQSVGGAMAFLLPFAAGGFLYIAASDLIPELHKEPDTVKSVASFVAFLVGVVLMWALKLTLGG